MADVTLILQSIEAGDAQAVERLLPLVYEELRRFAAAKMADERSGQTLQATALVHEAYVRLVDVEKVQHWNSRGHFFGAAAEAMRRILVEAARRKRLSGQEREQQQYQKLLDANRTIMSSPDELLDLNDALDKLTEVDPQVAELVKLRFFAGLSVDRAADVLGISPRTARRSLLYAKAWLRRQMESNCNG